MAHSTRVVGLRNEHRVDEELAPVRLLIKGWRDIHDTDTLQRKLDMALRYRPRVSTFYLTRFDKTVEPLKLEIARRRLRY
jgi:hypothetical protein